MTFIATLVATLVATWVAAALFLLVAGLNNRFYKSVDPHFGEAVCWVFLVLPFVFVGLGLFLILRALAGGAA